MNNISKFEHCYGCGVCTIICPTHIIEMKENNDGFYQPTITNVDKCINCGLCLDVCAFNHNEVASKTATEPHYYAAWSNNQNTRYNCSSGGIGYDIATHLLSQGYKACGVRYNITKQRAEHFMSENTEDYKQSIGSKYIPSFTTPGFSQINKTDKFLITGTPCQIDSIRRYIQKKRIEHNFILMDFFCHGVPSLLMWDKYLKTFESFCVTDISWRNKKTGWHDSWAMSASNGSKEILFSLKSKGDLFYQMFLGHHCFAKACYANCKYKQLDSAADIRIGDLWGDKFKNDKDGVSGVIAFTEQGNNLLSEISQANIIQLNKEASDIILSEQMKECAKKPWSYLWVKYSLQTHLNLKVISFIAKCICHIEKKLTK